MATIKGDGIIIASGNNSTTQEFSLTELQLNDFTVNEGVATFTLGAEKNEFWDAFCLYIKTNKSSYLFPAVAYSKDSSSNVYSFAAKAAGSSGFIFSSTALAFQSTTYTWSIADSGATDTDLMSGNFTVKAYSLVL